MKKALMCVLGLALAVTTGGCATGSSLGGSSYSRASARRAQTMRVGQIVSIQEVTIEATEDSGMMGGIGGAVLGAALGSTIGGGSGKTVAMAAGGVGGALLGSKVGEAASRRAGLEITVQYADNGQFEIIVQEPDKDPLFEGQQVRVLTEEDGTKRVRPLPSNFTVVPVQVPVSNP